MQPYSLRQAVKREIKEHIGANPTFKAHQINWYQRLLRLFSRNLLNSAFLIVIVYLLVGTADFIFGFPFSLNFDTSADSVLGSLNLVLLASQAAILGIVYPIVIGLISVMFDPRMSREMRIQVLLSETELIPSAASGFFLLGALSIQGLLLDHLYSTAYFLFSFMNVIWFLINLVGAGYFLWKARIFLISNSSDELITDYTVNVGLPAEFSSWITKYLWENSTEPSSNFFNLDAIKPLEVATHDYLNRADNRLLTRKFNKAHELVDVRFWYLNLALRIISKRLKSNPEPNLSIQFPVGFHQKYPRAFDLGADVTLVSTSDKNVRLQLVERWLFRRAFKFKEYNLQRFNNTSSRMLEEMASPVLLAISDNKEADFDRTFGALKRYFQLLISLSASGPKAKRTNLALHVGDYRSLFDNWVEVFREPTKYAVGALNKRHSSFFKSFSYLPYYFMSAGIETVPIPILTRYLDYGGLVHYLLCSNWKLQVAETELVGSEQVLETQSLNGAQHAVHLSAVRGYIEAWESTFRQITGNKPSNLSDKKKQLELLDYQLKVSCELVGKSVVVGDEIGALWLVDMLVRWPSRIENEIGQGMYSNGAIVTINDHSILEPLEAEADDFELQPRDAQLSQGLLNYWTDVTILTSGIFILWAYNSSPQIVVNKNCALSAAKAILTGSKKDPLASTRDARKPFNSLTDFSNSLLRMLAIGTRWQENTYAGHLSGFAEKLDRLIQPEYIAGRIYSFSGGDTNIEQMQLPIAVIYMGFMDAETAQPMELLDVSRIYSAPIIIYNIL